MIHIINYNYSLIERVKQELPVLTAFNRYLPGYRLQQRGRKIWSCCPFHNEDTASFMIDPDKDAAHCFGCSWHGDGIDLAREATGWTLKQLAADLGIVPAQNMSLADRRERAKRLKEQKRLNSLVKAIERDIKRVYIRLASMLRMTYAVTRLNSEEDLDRPGLSLAFDLQVYIPLLLDELESDDPGRQLKALEKSRELIL